MELKTACTGIQFQAEAKDYVINMLSKKRKLHKKNKCYYSKSLNAYYDFDTLSEAESSGLEYTHCLICFPEHTTP